MSEMKRETSRTGVQLATREWHPDGATRAAILIVHGIAEHSGRYEHVGEAWAGRGFAVFTYDHRGHGESGGVKGHIDTWDEYLDDLEDRLSAARFDTKKPLVLYGHSLGGLLALDYCLMRSEVVPDLLVLSGPALKSTLAKWKQVLAPLIARVAPRLRLPLDLKGEHLSRDPSVAEKYFDDPLIHEHATAKFGAEALQAQQRVTTMMESLAIPTLVLAAADDQIVPPQSSIGLGELPGVERRLYPGLRHELHNEPEGPEIVAGIADWIDARLD